MRDWWSHSFDSWADRLLPLLHSLPVIRRTISLALHLSERWPRWRCFAAELLPVRFSPWRNWSMRIKRSFVESVTRRGQCTLSCFRRVWSSWCILLRFRSSRFRPLQRIVFCLCLWKRLMSVIVGMSRFLLFDGIVRWAELCSWFLLSFVVSRTLS